MFSYSFIRKYLFLVHNGGIAEKGFTVPDSKRDQATVGKASKLQLEKKATVGKASKLQLEKHRSISGRKSFLVIQSAVVKTGVVNIFGYTV